jgi:putative FmdB family regulatory protein
MPLYEYRCENCGELFEVMQKFSDEPLKTHEKCGGAVQRLLSAPALQFKGSGWYITDYARGSNAPAASNGESKKADAPSSTTASSSDSSKSSSASEKASTSSDTK